MEASKLSTKRLDHYGIVAGVCQEIGLPIDLVSLFLVNGELRSKDYLLQANDEVKLIALVGGG